MPVSADLPDVNVWLAMSVSHHPHHERALAYWREQAAQQVSFCRVTMLGLVRLLTQPRVMGDAALSPAASFEVWSRWQRLPEVTNHDEPATLDTTYGRMLEPDLPTRLLTDAYLAALALTGGMRLVTFDADFRRFAGLELLLLDPGNTPP